MCANIKAGLQVNAGKNMLLYRHQNTVHALEYEGPSKMFLFSGTWLR